MERTDYMTVNLDTYKLGNKIQFVDCNDNSSERYYDKATQWNMMDALLNFFDYIGNKNVIFRDGLLSDDLGNRIIGDVAWLGTREDVDELWFDHEVGNYEVIWNVRCDDGWYVKIIIRNSYVESSQWTYELIVK
jgi:hypothetical protein